MNRLLRSMISGTAWGKQILGRTKNPIKSQEFKHHDGPTLPFDNLPFSVPNRYVATAFACVFFGSGLYAPFAIIWYSMAKKTM